MKTLMTATALTALIAASSAFGQAQDPLQDPLVGEPPAAIERAPDVLPDAMSPVNPETGAGTDTLDTPDHAAAPRDVFITRQDADDILASELIGASVENPANEDLGDINDVVLSEDGTVDAIIIGVGGFLGIGQKNVAVAFDAIDRTIDADGNTVLVFNASKEALDAAPAYVTVAEMRRQQEMEQPVTTDPMAPPPAQ